MKEKKLQRIYYSDEFKWEVVQKVLLGELSKEDARQKYNIKGKSAILKWIRKFGGIKEETILNSCTTNLTQPVIMKELSEKDKRIKELEESLKQERLRANLWQKIVEIAENQFDIDIKKKYGAKQSIPSKNRKKIK